MVFIIIEITSPNIIYRNEIGVKLNLLVKTNHDKARNLFEYDAITWEIKDRKGQILRGYCGIDDIKFGMISVACDWSLLESGICSLTVYLLKSHTLIGDVYDYKETLDSVCFTLLDGIAPPEVNLNVNISIPIRISITDEFNELIQFDIEVLATDDLGLTTGYDTGNIVNDIVLKQAHSNVLTLNVKAIGYKEVTKTIYNKNGMFEDNIKLELE